MIYTAKLTGSDIVTIIADVVAYAIVPRFRVGYTYTVLSTGTIQYLSSWIAFRAHGSGTSGRHNFVFTAGC